MTAILALATSGPEGEVGLGTGGDDLAVAALGTGAARGRAVARVVDDLLAEAGMGPGALDAVGVDVGPGSFTGVRVGVATAKTLAWALDLPVVGVLSLEALARAAPPERTVVALRDAGRGRVYAARYGPRRHGRRAVLTPPHRAPAAALVSLLEGSLAVGEEAPALVGGRGEARTLRAGAAAVLAETRAALDEGRAVPPHALAPVYLQASTPEEQRAAEDREQPPAAGARNDRT